MRSRRQKIDPVGLRKSERRLQQIKNDRLDSLPPESIDPFNLSCCAVDSKPLLDPCLGQGESDIAAADNQDGSDIDLLFNPVNGSDLSKDVRA